MDRRSSKLMEEYRTKADKMGSLLGEGGTEQGEEKVGSVGGASSWTVQ